MTWKAALLLLSAGSLGGCCGATTPPVPPPECKLDTAPSFAPAAGSPAMKDLERANANAARFGSLTGDDLVLHCKSKWQDIIDQVHCPQQLTALCDKNCPNAKCKEPPHSEAVMKKCRADSLPVFSAQYPVCKDYHLCNGTELEPATVQCKHPS